MGKELETIWDSLANQEKVECLKQAKAGACNAPKGMTLEDWEKVLRYLKSEKLARVAFIEGSECEAISLTKAGKEKLLKLERKTDKPKEPSTKRAKLGFQIAINKGYMEKTETGYKWLIVKAALAVYMVGVYNPDGTKETPFTALEKTFGEKALAQAYDKAENEANHDRQKWRKGIEKMLEELDIMEKQSLDE